MTDISLSMQASTGDNENDIKTLKHKRLAEAFKTISEDRQALLGYGHEAGKHQQEVNALRQALADGIRPSEYVEQHLSWLWKKDFIPETMKDALKDAVDLCLTQPYAISYHRRSYRSKKYGIYTEKICFVLLQFANDVLLPYPLTGILTGDVPEAARKYLSRSHFTISMATAFRIASALNQHDEAVEAAIREMIDGDGKAFLMHEVIYGILYSHRSDMYELLGRLLLAARLQEGLRQAICEKADMGTEEAFRYMVGVIDDNNLIRFSAVKRAVGTWLGLISEESGDLERISSKSIKLVRRCLEDAEYRKECLRSEDSMQIYIALWAIGVTDVQSAMLTAWMLALKGSHHLRLTAGYFVQQLDSEEYASALAKKVLMAFPDELDTVAVYLPCFMPYATYHLDRMLRNQGKPDLSEFYADAEEARRFYKLLLGIRNQVRKKQVFDPCIFPWNREVLDKAQLAERLCVTARLLEDDQLLDDSITFFPECDVYQRHVVLKCCYGGMRTPKQRQLVLQSICDKGEYCRQAAIELVNQAALTDEDYRVLEGLLRYKYADARTALILLLQKQEDQALMGTIRRLLADQVAEKRLAALDLVKQVAEQPKHAALRPDCAELLSAYAPTDAEQTMVESLQAKLGTAKNAQLEPLFTEADVYQPELVNTPLLLEALTVFQRYFPDSGIPEALSGDKSGWLKKLLPSKDDTARQAEEDLDSLCDCYKQHQMDSVKEAGEDKLLCNVNFITHTKDEGGVLLFPVWSAWYQQSIGDPQRLLRACLLVLGGSGQCKAEVQTAFGKAFSKGQSHRDSVRYLREILNALVNEFAPQADLRQLAAVILCWIARCVPDERLWYDVEARYASQLYGYSISSQEQLGYLLKHLDYSDDAWLTTLLPAGLVFNRRSSEALRVIEDKCRQDNMQDIDSWNLAVSLYAQGTMPTLPTMLRASYLGLLSQRNVYHWLHVEANARKALFELTALYAIHRGKGRSFSLHGGQRIGTMYGFREAVKLYLGKEQPVTEEDHALLRYAEAFYEPLLERILKAELTRGDSMTDYTLMAGSIQYLDGADRFTAILAALGKEKLVRSYYYGNPKARVDSLCHLLTVCVPNEQDTADSLRQLVKERKISDKQLIEAALYCPEWVDLIGEVLALPGFRSAAYYFMAHMDEEFDETKKARIARFTPLSTEELNDGAFDIDWFRSAYAELGEKPFDMLYDAAKYITSGAKHARARKYADAVLGRLDLSETLAQITEKRNKDLLMAYALIPLHGDEDLQQRYLYIQRFLKESRSFGAQRAASEKTACEVALTNLAHNAGYSDTMRLTLRMETRLAAENAPLFDWQEIDGVRLRLAVDEQGITSLACEKAGKPLKSVPAKLKKHETVLRLNEVRKQMVEQQRRARRMLEEAMENATAFTAGEIAMLMGNPVIAPMLRKLVFMKGADFGFTDGMTLTGADGATLPLNEADELTLAHPFHLWKAQQWLAWQRRLFADQIVQPIKQVFRELYVKTPDELGRTTSLRYAGHQLQPAKTLATLRTRRWLVDPEEGLQKVFYKENIVATIWALADWFSPADIEAPTLEWVVFRDRKTGKEIKIDDVPDLIFSEVMRDVDLAVSVAHAGGVDPQASHSTMEMRAALLSFTLPLFRLTNVRVEKNHAIIDGALAQYTVHLGSGVVHQVGGTMLSVLPVHSQHRGRLFLPFADDDPKTAEILSKVLLFAEDSKLKDPTILSQINSAYQSSYRHEGE